MVALLGGCGGGGTSSDVVMDRGSTPALLSGPHLYRDLNSDPQGPQNSLQEVRAQQADSPDLGTVREFTATEQFLILPPAAFFRDGDATWQTDETAALNSVVYLRPDSAGHKMRIQGRTGFRGLYDFGAADAVPGWGSGAGLMWPELYSAKHPSSVGIEHDIALAYTDALDNEQRLQYAAYGWWALAPTAGGGSLDNSRVLSGLGGMNLGLETFPRDMPANVNAIWRGRATGHALDATGRWVLEGDALLAAELRGASGTFVATIRNTRIAPVDAVTLQPDMSRAGRWHTVELEGSAISGVGYSGRATVSDPIREIDPVPADFAGPQMASPRGRYSGVFYGPAAEETAGQWFLLEAYPGRNADMGEMVVVGSFGGRRQPASTMPTTQTLDTLARPHTFEENNYRVSRLEDLDGTRRYGYFDNARSAEASANPGGFINPYRVTLAPEQTDTLYTVFIGGRYGYEGTYSFGPGHRVDGFGDNLADVTWQPIWHRQQLPSDRNSNHDVMISITDRGLVGADLDYALYGWWAITPYDGKPGHPYYFTLNAVGGIGVGLPTEVAALPASGTWKGRITGHVGEQPDRNRYTVDGELTLNATTRGGSVELDGVIDNTHIIAVDRDTLQVMEGGHRSRLA